MLTLSVISFTPLTFPVTPVGVWLGGVGYGGQGEAVVTQFVEAGRESDIEEAVSLTYDPVTMRSDVENFIVQNRYLFDDFQDAKCTGWNYSKEVGQPAVLALQGELVYTSDPKGTFECYLVKSGGVWKVGSLSINRPPQ